MTDLKELALRVENLDGSCRETDAMIAKAIGQFKPDTSLWRLTSPEHQIWHHFSEVMNPDVWTEFWEPEIYTRSTDAALGLIPGGWEWEIQYNMVSDYMAYQVKMGEYISAQHPSPLQDCKPNLAIAITAAALRAIDGGKA